MKANRKVKVTGRGQMYFVKVCQSVCPLSIDLEHFVILMFLSFLVKLYVATPEIIFVAFTVREIYHRNIKRSQKPTKQLPRPTWS